MALINKASNFLNVPQSLGPMFNKLFPGFWNWLTSYFNNFIANEFSTLGDITLLTNGKGIILVSPGGIKYKLTVADDGTVVSNPI